MSYERENRRVRMTKRLIKDAFLELLEKQDLISISVTAICKAADVHRSTFYNYYKDPADLLYDIEQDFLERIPAPPEALETLDKKMLLNAAARFFDYITGNEKTVRILFSKSVGSDFSALLVDHLQEGYIPVGNNSDPTTAHYIQLYIANGTVGMLREWISAGFPLSSENIAELMYSLSTRISR